MQKQIEGGEGNMNAYESENEHGKGRSRNAYVHTYQRQIRPAVDLQLINRTTPEPGIILIVAVLTRNTVARYCPFSGTPSRYSAIQHQTLLKHGATSVYEGVAHTDVMTIHQRRLMRDSRIRKALCLGSHHSPNLMRST